VSSYQNFKVFDGDIALDNKAVTGKMEIIYEALEKAENNGDKLENAVEKYKEDGNENALWTKAYRFSEGMLRNIEKVESEFPDLLRETGYGRLHNSINHMYWRLDEDWWKENGSQSIIDEIEKISDRKRIIEDIKRAIRQNLETEYFRPPVDDFKEEFQQAKDLIALEHYDTAIFVMCRACEQAQFVLGKERNIESVEVKGNGVYAWESDDLYSWARNEALYSVDSPDGDGKMIDRPTRERFQRVFTELRNDVAHLSKQDYDREKGIREFKNLKELLMTLSERISDVREYEEEIDSVPEQTVSHPN
jgi:hypothetical protein